MSRLLFGTLFVVAATPLAGQQELREPECAQCCIAVDLVLMTRGSEAEPVPGLVRSFAARGDGTFAATFAMNPHVPYLIERRGGLRPLGRSGGGPGEYQGPTMIGIGRADSLYAADLRNARMSVHAPSGEFVRSYQILPYPVDDFVVLPDGGVVLASNVSTPDLSGLMLHRYSPAGERMADFGDEGRTPRMPDGNRRLVGADAAGRLWALDPASYRLLAWEENAERPRVEYVRRATWFEAHDYGRPIAPDGSPVSFGLALEVIGDTAMVLVAVPDARWRDYQEQRMVGASEVSVATDLDRTFDTIIEFIDLRTGSVLSSRRFDPAVGLASGRYIARGPSADDSDAVLRVWSVEHTESRCEEEES